MLDLAEYVLVEMMTGPFGRRDKVLEHIANADARAVDKPTDEEFGSSDAAQADMRAMLEGIPPGPR